MPIVFHSLVARIYQKLAVVALLRVLMLPDVLLCTLGAEQPFAGCITYPLACQPVLWRTRVTYAMCDFTLRCIIDVMNVVTRAETCS